MTGSSPASLREPLRSSGGITARIRRAGLVTTERIDPLSAVAARPVTGGILAIAAAMPLLTLLSRGDEVRAPTTFAAAALLVVASVIIILERTRAHRPVFSAQWGVLLYALLAAVLGLAAASTFGANALLRDDWAPFVVGLVLLALSPYRPAVELAVATAGLTAVSATLAVLQAPYADAQVPLATFAVSGSSSLASLGCASAAYALSMNGSILAWLDQAWRSAAAAAVVQRGGVARSVQQQRVSLVNRRVVPYFARIGAARRLTPSDREEARELAQSIRALLIADVQRGWAQSLLDEICSRVGGQPVRGVADDPEDAGRRLTMAQRTLLRAIGMEAVERVRVAEIALRIRATETGATVRWTLTTPAGAAAAVRVLRPTLHLVRGHTLRARLGTRADAVTLEFEYGH